MTQDAATCVRTIALFWWPLAFSWLFMGLEGPLLQAVISHSDGARVQLAAFGLVLGLEILIESPVIMLLATATALGRDLRSCRMLFRFQLALNGLLTLVALAVAFTPLFELVVVRLLHAPPEVAEASRSALKIMVLWTAAIGWRRHHQGLLIRGGRTQMVGIGTAVRLVCTTGTAAALWWQGRTSGVETAACALMAGVLAEAVVATVAARPVLRHLPERVEGVVLTSREVLRFHMPLAATSILSLLVQPLVLAALGRMADPVPNMAAWPVVFSLFMVMRSGTFALPETLIALSARGTPMPLLRRFSMLLGAGTVTVALLILLTPVLPWYLERVLELEADLVPRVVHGCWFGMALPLAHGLQSYLRGRLMAARHTSVVNAGMMIYVGFVAVAREVGVWLQTPGVETAMAVISMAMLLECAFLAWRSRRVFSD